MGSWAKDAAAAWPGSESAGSMEASGGDGGDVKTPMVESTVGWQT